MDKKIIIGILEIIFFVIRKVRRLDKPELKKDSHETKSDEQKRVS